MASNSYAANRVRALRAPIAGAIGRTWATALGSAQDDEAPNLLAIARCHSPLKASDDALPPVLGAGYMRSMAPRENFTGPIAYRARLGNAWPFWESAPTIGDGALTGLSSLFAVYAAYTDPIGSALSPVVVCDNSGPAGFSWFSEMIFVWSSSLQPDDAWDSADLESVVPVYDDGGIWDVEYIPGDPYAYASFGVADLDWFKREIRLCKGAQAYPVAIAVGLGFDGSGCGPLWDGEPQMTWDGDANAVWDWIYTSTYVNTFIQPSSGNNVFVTVVSTKGMSVGDSIYIASGGYYTVSLVADEIELYLMNTGTAGNAAPGTSIAVGSLVTVVNSVASPSTVWPLGHVWGEEIASGGGPGSWDDGDSVAWDDGTTESYAPPSGGW